ncbi:MAG: DUF3768 domain-containing protein [Alphaproteobacteria bacterium]|nr:DUF3768 domain-containing protein [Alphaproteobacteria bacterium]
MADIKTLNDELRHKLPDGHVMLTRGIFSKSDEDLNAIMQKVIDFSDFNEENDPYGEHDFGSFDYKGDKIYWKIDYYDLNCEYLSEDPSNPNVTNRILTIMLAEEY